MGKLISIVYKPQCASLTEGGYTRLPLQEALLVVGSGIAGDTKGNSLTRQINIMAADTMHDLAKEGFSAAPGEMGEQLILAEVEIDSLPVGAQLQIGAIARIEVIEPRTGCGKFERYQGKLKSEAAGRLGKICRVVAGGTIRLGDPVHILAAAAREEIPIWDTDLMKR